MRIDDSKTTLTITDYPRTIRPPAGPTVPALRDVLQISEAAQQKIDQLQQGNQALEQALTQSRQSARNAAIERVQYIKDYLNILARMSPVGDRGAASVAARMAREIKGLAHEFKGNMASGEESGARSEIAGFARVAGETLNIANKLVESYLRKRSTRQPGDADLEKEIGSAVSTVREMGNKSAQPNQSSLTTSGFLGGKSLSLKQ